MIRRSLVWTLRVGGGILVVVGILFVVIFLALKYWLLPDISRYRPNIEKALSSAAGVPISIAEVEGRWEGARPRLSLHGLAIADETGRPALFLDQVQGSLSWWTLLQGAPRFHSIEVDRPVLAVRRDNRGQLFVAGIALEQTPTSEQAGFGDWLLRQDTLIVNNATILWRDALASDTPFILTELNGRVDNHGAHHRFEVSARPPADVSGPLEVRGDLRGQLVTRLADWTGEMSARAQHADLAALRKYLRLPPAFTSGRGDVSAALEGQGGGLFEARADVNLEQVIVELRSDGPPLELQALAGRLDYRHLKSGFEVAADNLRVTLPGKRVLPPGNFRLSLVPGAAGKPDAGKFSATQFELSALQPVLNSLPLGQGVRERLRLLAPTGQLANFTLQWETSKDALASFTAKGSFSELGWRALDKLPGMSGLTGTLQATQKGGTLELAAKNATFTAPNVLWEPLAFASLDAEASWKVGAEQTMVDIKSVKLANRDFSGALIGQYKTLPGRPGWIDLSGKFVDIDGPSTHRYLPRLLGEQFRQWLKHAIQAGRGDANLVLKGDLYEFPFADDRGGVFKITAKARDAVFNYAPGWPAIHGISTADLMFHGQRMEVRTTGGKVFDTLKIGNALAVIADLAHHDELIEISGAGSGGLQDGLRFIRESPVREATRGALDRFEGGGTMQMSLKLTVPIRRLLDTAVGGNVVLSGNALDDGKGDMPAVSDLKGELRFTEKGVSAPQLRARMLGGPALLRIASPTPGVMTIDASGKASAEGLRAEMKNVAFKYLTGVADWKARVQIAEDKSSLEATASTTLFGEPAKFALTRARDGTLLIDGGGTATPAVLARELNAPAVEYLSGNIDWKARIASANDKASTQISARAQAFGGPLALELTDLAEDRVSLRASGEADVAALRKAFDAPLLQHLGGRTAWNGEFSLSAKQQRAKLSSNLVGVASDLPAPLGKAAATPMRLEIDDTGPGQNAPRLTKLRLADIGAAQALFTSGVDGHAKLSRAEIAFGAAAAPKPQREGVWLSGSLPTFDADGWRSLLALRKEGKDSSAQPSVSGADVKIGKLTLFGRGFRDLALNASQGQGGAWRLTFGGPEVTGTATWRADAGGEITGQFETLTIPAPVKVDAAQRDDLGDAPALRETPGMRYPTVRITAQDFRIGGRKLGRLELDAFPQGQDWRMRTVSIKNPHATFSADGIWQGWLKRPQTSLNLQLSAKDVGGLLGDLGYPNTVKAGTAELSGSLSWLGETFALNPPTLTGNIVLSAKSGQFLKAEPGVAKLLGILSLQSLPRRITLDFRDVFSSGFAFNEIAGNIAVTRGVLTTEDLTMWGPSATVALTGSADVARETQDLTVKVAPSLGETVAVAGALAAGPAAGAAAYVVQKLLRNPIDKAFAFQYKVTGKWEDPVVTKVARPVQEKPRLLR